jgi:hypothetical protein
VHENVQPVIHKEIIQPEVVHSTVPIHETHHAQSEHHGTSTLPVQNLADFKAAGGNLAGGARQTHETYEGDPRPCNPVLQSERTDADEHFNNHDGLHDHQRALRTTGASTTTAPGTSAIENKGHSRIDSKLEGQPGMTEGQSGSGTAGGHPGTGEAAALATAGTVAGTYEANKNHNRDGLNGGQTSGESDEARRIAAEAKADRTTTNIGAGLDGTGMGLHPA